MAIGDAWSASDALHFTPNGEMLAAGLSYGSGCPGQLGTPLLGVAGPTPRVDASFALQITGAAPNSPAWIAIGIDQLADPDLGVIGTPGCQLRSEILELLPASVDAAGIASVALSVPADGNNAGLEFTCQGFVAEHGTNPLGLVVTNGLQSQIAP